MRKNFLIVVAFFLLLFSFEINAQKTQVLALSKKVVSALKNKDMKTLATLVHPLKAVRFSPFGGVDKKEDLVFKGNQLPALLKSKKVYKWGIYDESEMPIKKTFAGYYEEFVYDYDFAKPDRVNYNLKKNNGIMINNIAEAYPKGIEVEYFFDGTDDRMYGSLRLIYEKSGKKWYLVGIVRDTPGI
jgi:hypothetical protein